MDNVANKADEILTEAQDILKKSRASGLKFTGNGFQHIDKQVRRIVRIAKYKFHWSRKSLFGYILKSFPELESRLKPDEIKYSKTSALYQLMTSQEKSLIIKRLEQIEKKNKTKIQSTIFLNLK